MNDLDAIIQSMVKRSINRLIRDTSHTNSFVMFLDTPETRTQRILERNEARRIEVLLAQEYGPAIEPGPHYNICDCEDY